MGISPYVPVGRVVKAHGSSGEVSVAPVGDLPLVVPPGATVWFVPPPDRPLSARVETVREGPKGPLVKVSGVDSPEGARRLTGTMLLVHEDDLPDGRPEEPFDPVGLRVSDVEGRDLGSVRRVIVTGANDVWVTEGPLGEVLLPVIEDVFVEIDHDGGTARVRLLPGLLPGEEG